MSAALAFRVICIPRVHRAPRRTHGRVRAARPRNRRSGAGPSSVRSGGTGRNSGACNPGTAAVAVSAVGTAVDR